MFVIFCGCESKFTFVTIIKYYKKIESNYLKKCGCYYVNDKMVFNFFLNK